MLLTISLIWESVIWSVAFQNFICILYWTKSIRVVFKRSLNNFWAYFPSAGSTAAQGSGSSFSVMGYFKAKSNRPRTSIGSHYPYLPSYLSTYLPTISKGTSSGSSGVISLADLQGQHETVRSWNTSLQLEHLLFLAPQHSTKVILG